MLESARMLGDPSGEFAERSKLFRDRGLSSDTSLMPNFAIERSFGSMKSRGLLPAGHVRRVAIIGPGLDFTDKQDGYDFYPQQTTQPFAVIDSLLRLGLARPADLRVTTLDLSARINDHLRNARARAAQAMSYIVQLPRDSQWKPELADYWSKFGDRIGESAAPVAVPSALGDIKVRAVKIRPAVVSLVSPEDLNVVLQRLDLPPDERFDLIIATNILVYYDMFEQSLALANIEKMLRPGGFLLSNNALLELPGSNMHSVDYETVVYSDRENDGDHIVWYQRAAQ
jgi:SAM-dependent methyltransferase